MLLRAATFLLLVFAFVLSSCSPQNSQVIAKFGNQTVNLKDFENAYAANAGGIEKAKKDSLSKIKDYLNLYVDFRMKLRDAYVRGYDQDSSIQAEVKKYKKEIGVTYLLDKQLIEPAVQQLYNRRKWEYRVSHLMIRPDSSGLEAAKIKAEKILDSLKNGADWDKMVERYSDDKFSAKEGGDIFYVTAGELPYQFEDAVYDTQPGQIYPKVVQTQFGFHIIKVTDKRERRPEIKASHILIAFYDKTGKLDSTGAWDKINLVMQKLKQGEDFATLAKEYSDDPGSKPEGGDLGYFSIRRMVKPFAEAAFNLKKIGDISGIVKSRFGYHIIKLTGIKPIPSIEEEHNNLKQIYQKTRYLADYDSLTSKLKLKYNYKLNNDIMSNLINDSDTLMAGQTNPSLDKIKNDVLFTYDGNSYSVENLLNFIGSEKIFENKKMNSELVNAAVNKASDAAVLDHEADNLDKTDSAFAALMKNYRDGIYIFKLQEDEVWNKVKSDSTQLYNYYEKNKDKYITNPRVSFKEIYSKSDSLINYYYSQLKAGKSFDSLAAAYTERPSFKDRMGSWGYQDSASSVLSLAAFRMDKSGDFSEPIKFQDGYSIVQLVNKQASHLKTFEEAKPEVSSAYQELEIKKLENEYIAKLNKLYKPEIYYDKLEEAFKTN